MKTEKLTNRMSTIESSISLGTAGRHETFTPRYGWLKKGYDRCVNNPHVFNDDNAIEQIGVGKNMVRSIRFWCVLFRLLEDAGEPGCLKPTSFGSRLLNTESGWDPYLEDPASLWLLHWQIFLPPYSAVSWVLAFNYIDLSAFDGHELGATIVSRARTINGLRNIAEGSFDKDASCILRMYCSDENDKNEIRSPFRDLGVIVPAKDVEGHRFRFAANSKQGLPDLIFMAAVFSYANQWFSEQQSLSLNQITYGINSPGVAFKLSETECGSRIERVYRTLPSVSFIDNNGLRQLQYSASAANLFEQCLESYFEERV
jgi:hypothetical protein